MLKSFLLILSHKESTSRESQLKYLLENNKDRFIYYYFISDMSIPRYYKIDKKNNIVYLKVPDDYDSISALVYHAMKFISENFSDKISGIFKTDDDTNLDLDKLHDYIEDNYIHKYFGKVYKTKDHASDYHIGKHETNGNFIHIPECEYCAGGGYYITEDIMNNIIENKSIFEQIPYEDVCVGLSMNRNNIFPTTVKIKENGCSWIDYKDGVQTPPPPPPPPLVLQGRSRYVTEGSELCRFCGHPKNKIRYNFCQQCGRLY